MLRMIFIVFAVTIAPLVAQKNPHYVQNSTTMVHLFEWKWNEIADECERFLGPMGYGGVQVSPITENVKIKYRPWYERYQPISYKLETRSGTEKEFRSMVRRCNNAGVRIYVDILLNHMTGNHKNAVGTNDSTADPFNLDYPEVPYKKEHFHPICQITNYQDLYNVRNCELVGLHDLDQSQEYVRRKAVQLMNKIIDMGVAGFRIDAAKHMWPQDLAAIYSQLDNLRIDHGFAPNAKPFIYQEVIDYGNGEAVSKKEYNQIGVVMEFKFGQEISNAIRRRNPLKWFYNWGEAWSLLPSTDALTFIDNHDSQRNGGDNPLKYKDSKLYKMAIAFMLAHPYGLPQVISSFDFVSFDQGPPTDQNENIVSPLIRADNTCGNGWVCEHRWRQIYNMVRFRNYVATTKLGNWWDNGNYQIAFCRGDRGFFAMNDDIVDLKRKLQVCLPAGTYCDVITGDFIDGNCTGKSVKVDKNGEAVIEIRTDENDGVLAIHAGAKVA
ncbi:alpha-amylase-related protein-like [Phymastichus coffea]|uniref:alpha-amylase-related protein-like n=1 Tax=Phymastichus coffea TaxID=108790 RepID=UPI00273B55A5|nr:alpha-amylase-related protein-like [Phymastichus coffea]